jgi:hypothetical protein
MTGLLPNYLLESLKNKRILEELKICHKLQVRMFEIFSRHVREEDENLSDCELALAVIKRWRADNAAYLCDPNE